MKFKKLKPVFVGVTAVMASLLAVSSVGYGVADTYRTAIDDTLGTQSYIVNEDKEAARFKSDYATIDELAAAARDLAVREGEEGTVIMKNDAVGGTTALPLASGKSVALFGLGAYATYPYSSGDLKAGNSDAVDLKDALKAAGVTVNATVEKLYTDLMNKREEIGTHPWTGQPMVTVKYDYVPASSPGDMADFRIVEVPSDRLGELGKNADWKSSITKADTVGICVFSRPAGEGNMYKPDSAINFDGEPTGKDPLALSDDELSIVDVAKETCSKVVVLINSGNNMELGAIVAGGEHEVDAIAYIGCPNDYQFEGIVNVLTGKVNATGALPDTYVYDNSSLPAMQNVGGDYFVDYEIVASDSDSRFPGVSVGNNTVGSFGGAASYNGGHYIVEAEGIYIGYKYYKTRYYDSVMGQGNANGTAGATQATTWDYGKEVVYSFGHGLSYLDYEQNIKSIVVDKQPEGNITATVEVYNKSQTAGRFLAQLYVNTPYTEYDKENLVEKAAINYLNGKKVDVPAGGRETVEITIPTKYLASYDTNGAGTYILDAGTYYFTAAAGSHEAVNNVLAAQGKTTADGMDAEGTGATVTWSNAALDKTTYATDNGYKVENIAENADLNYWLPDTVTYLSRQNWQGTYPKNYNELSLKIADSPKQEEWIKEMRGQQYSVNENGTVENVNGKDNDVRFTVDFIGYEQLSNIDDPYWNLLVSSISVDQAVGGVIHGGSRTDVYENVDNPIVTQNEGVNGYTAAYTPADDEEAERDSYKFNIHSQTLIGSSFNEELAWEWGVIEGESGLWLQRYDIWGTGLTLRRTPYNGRNYEYISEDPMLTNRIGYGILGGAKSKGTMCGPKHIGCNDQEHNRAGVSEYMTEQKLRETDLRGFQGGLDDAEGLAVMVAFNRIGSTNASHHVGMLKHILREEWGFKGIISTDMMNNARYFIPEPMIMATVTQVADFGGNDNTISATNGHDSQWVYLSVDNCGKDATLVNQARENLKYQFYAFANSGVMNISTVPVTPWWETAIKTVIILTAVFTGLAGAAYIATVVVDMLPSKKDEKEAA